MPWSWLNTEYCIHQVQHHSRIDSLPLPASFSPLGRCCCTQLSTFPLLQVHQWIETQLPSRLPSNRPLPSTLPISLDHSLQVHLQTRSITASQCISELKIKASKGISKIARLQPPGASLNSLDHGCQVHHQRAAPGVQRYRGNGGGLSEGSTYSEDPGVDRHHLIFISVSSHLDPRNCVDSNGRVVSYLLTFFLGSSSQNGSFSQILSCPDWPSVYI